MDPVVARRTRASSTTGSPMGSTALVVGLGLLSTTTTRTGN
ncbi:hypothetical protein [Streptomyces sp. NPDC002426]